jgi:hypothetical protein
MPAVRSSWSLTTAHRADTIRAGGRANGSRRSIRRDRRRARRARIGGCLLGRTARPARARPRAVRAGTRARRLRGSLTDHPPELCLFGLRALHARRLRGVGRRRRRSRRAARDAHGRSRPVPERPTRRPEGLHGGDGRRGRSVSGPGRGRADAPLARVARPPPSHGDPSARRRDRGGEPGERGASRSREAPTSGTRPPSSASPRTGPPSPSGPPTPRSMPTPS